ncbi:TetR/AcrR family transcriptional regulator [Marinicrinis sediminis]|uniref:TetR/AcrR family transcriptional regulator n=1 Tax=Marinicrinis sediminis TaxID=1652465 RepID=A0ABW5R5V3_9BACL
MRKGEKTRQLIIAKSAELFNLKGYAGSSIQDIMEVTGLSKGAIYRSFSGKDEIATEAFAYGGRLLMDKFEEAVRDAETAIDKVVAVCEVHGDPVHNSLIDGGCPLLNTAVEADDGYPPLRESAIAAHGIFVSFIENLLRDGVKTGELQAELDAADLASFVVSSLEGGVMSSRLTRDNRHVRIIIKQIKLVLSAYEIRK